LESVCAFILRAGSRTLSTWNSCACHPCISQNAISFIVICIENTCQNGWNK
jgi:hypothetical protein